MTDRISDEQLEYLIKRNEGRLPHIMSALRELQERRKGERLRALDALTAQAQELDMGYGK
jgi:hypothetical protein